MSPEFSERTAHVHHAWDTFNRYGRTASAAKRAVIMSCACLFLVCVPLLNPTSVPILIHDAVWLPLLVLVPPYRFDISSYLSPHLLQYHGPARDRMGTARFPKI